VIASLFSTKTYYALAAEVAASSLPLYRPGGSSPSKYGSNPPKNKHSSPVRPQKNSAWHSLSLQPEKLCQPLWRWANVSVYELMLSRQVDVASGGLFERKEFSRRILPLSFAGGAPHGKEHHRSTRSWLRGFLGIVHRMLTLAPSDTGA